MHIGPGFLSPPVWGAMAAAGGAAVAGSLAVAGRRLDERKVPLMGVMGAFVFAAQMVNFPVLPGTTGHLGGGFLLGVLFGAPVGIIIMASVLVVQSLVFQDGGVEALGANIVAMGVVPCLLGAAVRGLWRNRPRVAAVASFVGATAAVVLGATLVLAGLALSGTSARLAEGRTFLYALGLMDGIHLAIGVVEGLISVAVIRFVIQMRPEAVWGDAAAPVPAASGGLRRYNRATLAVGCAVVLFVGGGLSYFAATAPDGLEKAAEELGLEPAYAAPVAPPPSLFDEYSLRGIENAFLGNAVAGIAGSLVVLAALLAVAALLMRRRRAHEAAGSA